MSCLACGSTNVHSSGLSGESVCEDCGTLVDTNEPVLVHRQLDEDSSTFHLGYQKLDGNTTKVARGVKGKVVERSRVNKQRRDVSGLHTVASTPPPF